MIVSITEEAERDFERIGDYIAQFNPARAQTFVEELLDRCLRLTDMPQRFALVPRHEHDAMRHFPHGNYVIYYRIRDVRVEIVRILHGAQDYEAILFTDE